ncbi:hemolysin (plasmid) [Falsirhodobacter algicola]|uniref:Hemolysin n=2 Tax=Falsirhodobacter algicola TaxID=2692330 RepID=A0A8J8SM96_9RHOB|nr:hemolysin [Falsirhodobacter algicola]
MTYDLGSGSVTARSDSTVVANVILTLGDGTVLGNSPGSRVEALIVQTTNGDVFVTDLLNAGTLDNLNIQSIQIESITNANSSGFFVDQSVDASRVVCFAAGTLIATPNGDVPVETLSVGDMVSTADGRAEPVRWIGSRRFTAAQMEGNAGLRPIRIRAGALGASLPMDDLVVSPQHRVLVKSRIAANMFGTSEVLVAAKQLQGIDGIDPAEDLTEVEYFHFMFDRHEVVISNGAATESLHTGPEALKSLGPDALAEVFTIFPELRDTDTEAQREAARRLLNGREGRDLAQRHANRNRELLELHA